MRKDAGKSKRGNMSLEDRRKKNEKKREKEKRLRGIKAKALKRMGVVQRPSISGARIGKEESKVRRTDAEDGRGNARKQKKNVARDRDAQKTKAGNGQGWQAPNKGLKKKSTKAKLMYAKTRKGQPLMKHKIEDILSRISS